MNLYLVRLVHPATGETFHKIGVTSQSVRERFSYGTRKIKDSDLPFKEKIERMLGGEGYIRDNPYAETILHQVTYTYDGDALIAERDLLDALKLSKYRPQKWFSGVSECFEAGEEALTLIKQHMNEDSSQKNAEAPSELNYKVAEGLFAKHLDDPIKKHLFVLAKCREQSGK